MIASFLLLTMPQYAANNPYLVLWDGLKAPGQLLKTVAQLEKAYGSRAKGDDVAGQALAVAYSFVGESARAIRTIDSVFPNVPAPFDSKPLINLRPVDPVRAIEQLAQGTHVVILNEAHHVPQTRSLTAQILKRLHRLGYRYYAAETLKKPSEAPWRGHPTLASGTYSAEPLFGNILRQAARLGYQVVPYEAETRPPKGTTGWKAIEWREQGETDNLVKRIFARDPNAKVVIHCGYSHAYQKPSGPEKIEWMAARLRRALGRSVVSVDLAYMHEASEASHEEPAYRFAQERFRITRPVALRNPSGNYYVGGDPEGMVNLQVFFPRTKRVGGREEWRIRALGGHLTALPFGRPNWPGRFLAEAVPKSESADAVPADRVVIWPGQALPKLVLPKGSFIVALYDESGRRLLSRPLRVGG